MIFNTHSLLLSAIISLTSVSARDLISTTKNNQCTVTENTRSDDFCFAVEIEIEGLRFDEVCTNHRTSHLEKALLKYHNEAIDCACNDNDVIYTDIQILPGGFEIVSGYGGDLEWCERRNEEKNLRRALRESDSDEFVDRTLHPNYLDLYPNYVDVTKIRYFASGTCGSRCPTNVFPGSNCFSCNRDDGSGFYGFRHLTNDDISECFESLFVNVLSSNPRFEGVTGVEVIRGTPEDPSVCDVTFEDYVAPKVTSVEVPMGRTVGKKGSKSDDSTKKGSKATQVTKKGGVSSTSGKKGSVSARSGKKGSELARSSKKGGESVNISKKGGDSTKGSRKGSESAKGSKKGGESAKGSKKGNASKKGSKSKK